jgi:glycosyltransferase involved in cell wall biosynthesis
MQIRVSVVLTTYNRAEALRQTIETVLAQTLREFELIVCDDCSPDGTEALVRAYAERDSRIVLQRNVRNLRMPGNLNAGIRNARGEYIANLHDGDYYDSTLLEKWAAALDSHPRAAFVFNQYRALNDDGTPARIYTEDLPDEVEGARLLQEWFFRRWMFDSPVWGTVMARREAYLRAGLFDERFSFISDIDMWMKLAENHTAAYIPEPLITLPGRGALPRQWNIKEGALIRQMFWEARMRHYRDRPARRCMEAVRHCVFSAAWSGYQNACLAKRWLTRSRSQAGG